MADAKVTVNLEVIGSAVKNIDEISKSVRNMEGAFQRHVGGSKRIFDVFTGTLAANVALKALGSLQNAAASLFDTFITQGVQSAQQEESAINSLAQAFQSSTGEVQKNTDAFVEFSNQMQATTGFANDAVLEIGALIQSLGQLDQAGLQRATKAALDLSVGLGIDLRSAALLVGKAAQGEIDTFGRYGLAIQKGKDNAETFANVLETLNQRFGGRAAGEVNTYAGAVRLASNNFSEIGEAVGFAIIQNQSLVNVIKEAGNTFIRLSGSITSNKDAISAFVSQGVVFAINSMQALVTVGDIVVRLFSALFNSVSFIVNGFLLLGATIVKSVIEPLQAVVSIIPGFGDAFSSVLESINNSVETFADSTKDSLAEIGKAFSDETNAAHQFQQVLANLEHSANAGFGSVSQGANQSKLAMEGATAETNKLNETQRKLAEEGARVSHKFNEQATTLEESLARQLEAISAAEQKKLITEQEAQVAREEARQQASDKELLQLQEKNIALAELDREKHAQEITDNQEKIDAILEQERISSETKIKFALREKQISEQKAAKEKQLSQERLQNTRDSLSTIATLTSQSNTTLFNIGKAAALAGAVVDGASAIIKALNTPFPLNLILPPLVTTAVAAQVATIASAKPPAALQTGIDSVPGTGTRDNFPALLAPGERVVPRRTNQDLTSFLSDQSSVTELLASIDSKITNLSNQTIVQIGDRVIVNELRSALQSGRVLAV